MPAAEPDPARHPGIVAGFVRAMTGSTADTVGFPDPAALLPVIRPVGFPPDDDRMQEGQTVPGGSPVLLVEDRPATPHHLSRVRIASGPRLDAALDRAVETLRRMAARRTVERGDFSMIPLDGNDGSSLLLLCGIREAEARTMRGDPVAAIPERDILIFADSADTAATGRLAGAAARFCTEVVHPVSCDFFRWTGPGRTEWTP